MGDRESGRVEGPLWEESRADSWRRVWEGRLPLRIYVTEIAPVSDATRFKFLNQETNEQSREGKPLNSFEAGRGRAPGGWAIFL